MGAAAGDVGQRKGTLTVPRGAPARAVSRGGPACRVHPDPRSVPRDPRGPGAVGLGRAQRTAILSLAALTASADADRPLAAALRPPPTGAGGRGQAAAMPPTLRETHADQSVGFRGAGRRAPPREIPGVTPHPPCRPRDTGVVSWRPRAPI